jgi:thiol:disulfide interchange protein DsbC
MKLTSALATAAISLVLALPALGQQPDTDRIRADLKKKLPEAPAIDAVRKIPYAGLYEVIMGNEVFYTDGQTSFLVVGQVIDLRTKENVTELRQRQLNKVNFADLPLDSAIKIVRGNGSRKVAIFEDPNCGYCKKFERDLAGVSDITVYVFLYPILSESSMSQSRSIWCSSDRAKAWLDHMVRDAPVTGDGSCANPIEKNLAFGQAKRITGTPTLIFEDGDRVPGVIPVAELEKKLMAAKNPPAKVSAQ